VGKKKEGKRGGDRGFHKKISWSRGEGGKGKKKGKKTFSSPSGQPETRKKKRKKKCWSRVFPRKKGEEGKKLRALAVEGKRGGSALPEGGKKREGEEGKK